MPRTTDFRRKLETDPAAARAEVARVFERAGCRAVDAARAFGVSRQRFDVWARELGLKHTLKKLRLGAGVQTAAQKQAWARRHEREGAPTNAAEAEAMRHLAASMRPPVTAASLELPDDMFDSVD
jgi:hypothetical protein